MTEHADMNENMNENMDTGMNAAGPGDTVSRNDAHGSLLAAYEGLSTRDRRPPLGIRFMRWGYKHVGKPIVFKMTPDRAHEVVLDVSERFGSVSAFDSVLHGMLAVEDPNLERTVMGVRYRTPFGLSAGLDKDVQLLRILDAAGFGFSSYGSLTLDACAGNPRPWFHRLPDYDSLLIHAGLPNAGAKSALDRADGIGTPYGMVRHASIGFTNRRYPDALEGMINDFAGGIALAMDSTSSNVVEVNVSCPNLSEGKPFQTTKALDRLFSRLDEISPSDGGVRKPVSVKMPSTDRTHLAELLEVLADHDVQGVVLSNLLEDRTGYRMPADWEGSMSGRPCHAHAVDAVKSTRDRWGDRFAIEGVGGIFTPEDALEMLDAGADLVAFVSTLMFDGPQQAAVFAYALSKAIGATGNMGNS